MEEIAAVLHDETETTASQPFIDLVSTLTNHTWTPVEQIVIHSTTNGTARIALRTNETGQNPILVEIPEKLAFVLAGQLHGRFELRNRYQEFFSHELEPHI
jgi:hypothetical protein